MTMTLDAIGKRTFVFEENSKNCPFVNRVNYIKYIEIIKNFMIYMEQIS